MKKRMLVAAAPLLFLIITTTSNGEMRITADGVTTPNESASLHLSGSASTMDYSYSHNPDGAIISGVNKYSSLYPAYGGYFEVSNLYGTAVYGYASGPFGNGVSGDASGSAGAGVYGFATNSGNGPNYGGFFSASGISGMGVYGDASGTSGRGVYGYASDSGNVTNYGVYGVASGTSGRGVYGQATKTGDIANYGGYFVAGGNYGSGVYGDGAKYDFFAGGSGNYGAFTGAHDVKLAEGIPGNIVRGMVVSVTGETEARRDKNGVISLSSTLPTVTISTKPRDKGVFGVVVSDGPLPEDHWYKAEDGERFGVVNALGEGRVWVTDINGRIEAGDYITTSSVPGYGQMQDDDLQHSYTLGKAIETIDWEQVTETVQYDGKSYKRYLIAVVYTSG